MKTQLSDNRLFSFRIDRRLSVPPETVWAALDDFGAHRRCGSFIEHARITSGGGSREGAIREVRLYDGSWMHQRIVDYRPCESMVIEVVQAQPLVRHHLLEIAVARESEHASRLQCRVAFRMPASALGAALGWYYRARLQSLYGLILRGLVQDLGDSRADRQSADRGPAG